MTLKLLSCHVQEDPRCGRVCALTGHTPDGQKVHRALVDAELTRLLAANGIGLEQLRPGAVIDLPAPHPFQVVNMREVGLLEDAEIAAAMSEGLEAVKALLRQAREESYRYAMYKGQRWLLASLYAAFFERRESRKAAMARLEAHIEGPVREWARGDCTKHEFAPFMDAEEPPHAG